MAERRFELDGIGEITVRRRRRSRHMRLSIAHDGRVRLSLPVWLPYQTGLVFARQKTDWIIRHRPASQPILPDSRVGKAHTLVFREGSGLSTPSVRVTDNLVVVRLPRHARFDEAPAQRAAERGALKALRLEAEHLLPRRVALLADRHDFQYAAVAVKRLKARWGSCSQDKTIVLNCFLMQLPWRLIDYVILHELTHTKILSHGPAFWFELGRHVQDLPAVRAAMRGRRPCLNTAGAAAGFVA